MIPYPNAAAHIQRLAVMRGFPKATEDHGDEKLDASTDHFRRAAQSEDHAEAMIDHILQHRRQFPEISDIWDAAKATAGGAVQSDAKPRYRECNMCAEGWATALVHYRWSNDKRPPGFVCEKIAEPIAPNITEHELFNNPMRYLTQQQYDRLEFLRGTWPPSYHSRYTIATVRCSRCWGGKAA